MPAIPMVPRAVLLLTLFAGHAGAGVPAVQDQAGFFSPEAVQRAEEAAREIGRRSHQNLRVETFPSPSRWKAFVLKLKSPEQRGRFYEDWARELARKAGPDSVVILVCREPAPPHVEVAAGRVARHKGFTPERRGQIKQALLAGIEEGHPDRGLLDAVALVRETLRVSPTDPDAAGSFPWPGVLAALIALLVVWISLESLDRFRQAKGGGEPGLIVGKEYGGGGSYWAGLFAGMNSPWVRELVGGLRDGRGRLAAAGPVLPTEADAEPHPDQDWLTGHPGERDWRRETREQPDHHPAGP